jgi:hypothetical protein
VKEGLYVPKELLEHLEKQFPDKCPAPDATDREVWMAVGAASVVRSLRSILNRQSKKALE